MIDKKWKFIIGCFLLFVLGFCLGRIHKIEEEHRKTEIKYVKQDPVEKDSIKPSDPDTIFETKVKYITKKDTIYLNNIQYITESVDTAAILSDWVLHRKYSEQLFNNDSIGSLSVRADVQYNQLQNLGYTFIPVRKETTTASVIVKKPLLEPFVLGGVNSYWKPTVEAGAFFRSGFGASYGIEWNDNSKLVHSLKVGYKF